MEPALEALDSETTETEDPRHRWRGYLHILGFLFALALVIGPVFLAAGANERLESECPKAAGETGSFEYDRESWLSLLWSCSVVTPDGEVDTIHVWETLW